jgi:Fe-S oxidoreductase
MAHELQTVTQTSELCRYCLMCRHVCPVTAVTRSEATSPHGWGLLIASVKRGLTTWNEDTVDVLYRCADCGLCQAHCATDQPLPLAINAGRAEVVAQQAAPALIYELQQRLQRWENLYQATAPTPVTGQGPDALLVGAVGQHRQAETAAAAGQLLAGVGVTAVPLAIGRESPYLANTLGLPEEARRLARHTLAEIAQVGARRLFVLSPGEFYAYQTVLPYLGLRWPAGVELVEVTAFLAEQLAAGRLALRSARLSDYTYFDPDQSVRRPGRWAAPRRLLAGLSDTPPTELFWRKERAAPCGASGGLLFTQPALAGQLAQARLAEAEARGINTIITDDPLALHHLRSQVDGSGKAIAIQGLFELLANNQLSVNN